MIRQTDLNQFTGSESVFQHPLNRKVVYTEGVRYLAEKAEAYWLIDAIASWLGSDTYRRAAKANPRIEWLHSWTLERQSAGGARLVARADSPDESFIVQNIEFTDFPLDTVDIWVGFSGSRWTLYLPSEH